MSNVCLTMFSHVSVCLSKVGCSTSKSCINKEPLIVRIGMRIKNQPCKILIIFKTTFSIALEVILDLKSPGPNIFSPRIKFFTHR